jgi:hypothetical protein
MARLAQHTPASADIDRYFLDNLFSEWGRLPRVEAEWESWEELDRLRFVLEWPLQEDRLHLVEGWAAEGGLTDEQMARLERLQELVRAHRPIVERLLSEDDPTIPRKPAR